MYRDKVTNFIIINTIITVSMQRCFDQSGWKRHGVCPSARFESVEIRVQSDFTRCGYPARMTTRKLLIWSSFSKLPIEWINQLARCVNRKTPLWRDCRRDPPADSRISANDRTRQRHHDGVTCVPSAMTRRKACQRDDQLPNVRSPSKDRGTSCWPTGRWGRARLGVRMGWWGRRPAGRGPPASLVEWTHWRQPPRDSGRSELSQVWFWLLLRRNSTVESAESRDTLLSFCQRKVTKADVSGEKPHIMRVTVTRRMSAWVECLSLQWM